IGAFAGGTVTTDSAGRYRYVAPISPSGVVEPHFGTVSVVASGPDIVPESASHGVRCCNSPEDTIFNFTVRRVLGVAISAPTTMRVGDTTTVDVRVTFDDGGALILRTPCPSDNPAVLAVENDSQGSRMRAISPGIATITCGYVGVSTTARIQVL
ncbi:MAG TPA: hypothetical protein VFU28_01440, partial [Vicinamibacterales bacterium]|nr:hypothetical protein [Vicinamibacterales bacterium]